MTERGRKYEYGGMEGMRDGERELWGRTGGKQEIGMEG